MIPFAELKGRVARNLVIVVVEGGTSLVVEDTQGRCRRKAEADQAEGGGELHCDGQRGAVSVGESISML